MSTNTNLMGEKSRQMGAGWNCSKICNISQEWQRSFIQTPPYTHNVTRYTKSHSSYRWPLRSFCHTTKYLKYSKTCWGTSSISGFKIKLLLPNSPGPAGRQDRAMFLLNATYYKLSLSLLKDIFNAFAHFHASPFWSHLHQLSAPRLTMKLGHVRGLTPLGKWLPLHTNSLIIACIRIC